MKNIVYIIFTLGILVNCTPGREAAADRLDYQIKTTVYKTAGCEPETAACLMATISYPVFDQGDSLAALLANRIIKNSVIYALGVSEAKSTLDLGIEEALAELDKQFSDLKEEFGNYRTGWSIEVNTRELFKSDTILVLETTYMTYLGGAHTNRNTRYFNFHRHTGSLVPLPAMAGNLEAFTAKAEAVFKRTYEINDSTSYADAGFSFLGNKFTLATNYAFLGDSIKLHYNPYEIAPYAAGDFEIAVPL